MKVAVLKLGSRISFNATDTSGGNGEARSIINALHQGGADVHIFTKILKKDELLPQFTWHNLTEAVSTIDFDGANVCDALVVLNGNVNFFGGAEDPEQLWNYILINHFKGPVFYLLCDPELTLRQVWPSVSKKPWAGNWVKEDLLIERKDIVYVSQPLDVQAVRDALKEPEVLPGKVLHFPFERFPCLNEHLPLNLTPSVDLSYGGTMRGGRRAKKMAKFYFGHDDISVEMFGKIKLDDFDPKLIEGLTPPTFTGPVKYDAMLPKMNDAMAHCVIGDPWYEKINDIPQRLFESIWASVVTFVDADMDKARRVYGNSDLADALYVSDKTELGDRIKYLKANPDARIEILAEQRTVIDFNPTEYCASLVKLLQENA